MASFILRALPVYFHGPIARSAAATGVMRVYAVGAGFITTLFLGAQLGVAGFGVFAFGASVTWLVSLLSRAGVQTYLVRASAQALGAESWGVLNGLRYYAAVAPAAGILMAVTASLLVPPAINPALAKAFLISAATAPILTLNAVAHALLRGLGKTARAYAPEFVIAPTVSLAAIIALVSIGQLTPQNALWALFGSWLVAAMASWIWLFAAWPKAAATTTPEFRIREWAGASTLVAIASLVTIVFTRIEVTLLGALSDAAEIGLYAMAMKFAQLVTFPGQAVGSGLAPEIARFDAANRHEEAQSRLQLGVLSSSGAAIAIAIFVVAASYFVLPLLGADYRGAAVLTAVLCGGFLVQAWCGRPMENLLMIGNIRKAAVLSLTIALLGVVVAVLLIKSMGALGAAIATSVIFTVFSITSAIVLAKTTRYRVDILFALARYLKPWSLN